MKKEPLLGELGESFFFYVLISLVVFGPCLFTHRAYFDSDLLAQFGPWRAFLKDQLAHGHFPLWDPYLLGGQPFFADLQNMMLYPLNYLTLPFSIPLGLTLFQALHWVLAAWGMDQWLSRLGFNPRASRLGALTYALSGFFWMEIIHPPVLAAFAWLPWWFACVEIWIQERKPRASFLAGLVFALLFLSGSFQVFLGAFYGGLAYFIFRLFQTSKNKHSTRANIQAFLFFLAGSFPLWGQLIPSLEFFSLSNRGGGPQNYWTFNTNYSLNPTALDHALFPALHLPTGQWMDHAVQNNRDFLANALYLGIWIPVLTFFSFRPKKDQGNAHPRFFLSSGLLTLALCFGGYFFVYHLVTRWIPGFADLRAPYRLSYFWVFSLSTLAAGGWQSLESIWEDRQLPKIWLAAVGLYGLAALSIAALRPEKTIWEMSALLLGFLAFGFVSRKKTKWIGFSLLGVALLLPLLLRGWGIFFPAPYSNFNFAANSKSLIKLTAPLMPSRIMLDPHQVPYPIKVRGKLFVSYYPENIFAALRLKDFGGYNPLSLKSVNDLRFLPADKIFKLMAIRGFLTDHTAGALRGFVEKTDTFLHLYKSRFSGSLAFAPRRWQVLEMGQDQLAAMKASTFDPYQEGILANPLPASESSRLTDKPAALRYRLLKDEPSAQSFQLNLSRDSLVVFSEVVYPGWEARLDGFPAKILTADHALRAIFIPAGSHRVDFTYQPWWMPWIFAPWIFTLGIGFWLFRRERF